MFAQRLGDTIAAATTPQLDHLAKLIWKGHSSGALTDGEAQGLAEAVQGRRDRRPAPVAFRRPELPPLIFARARPQRSPDKQRSLERRRTLAASSPLPPKLACAFTTGELAALRIIADEFRARGVCDRTIGEIAARAGVGMSTVRNAVRASGREGLLTVQERPRPGRKSLSNLVRVISREWLLWLARSPRRRPDGTPLPLARERGRVVVATPPFKKSNATESRYTNLRKLEPGDRPHPGL